MTKKASRSTRASSRNRSAVTGRYVTKAKDRRLPTSTTVNAAARGGAEKGIPKAVANDETGLDQLDPAVTEPRDASGFRRIVAAKQAVADAEAELRAAVLEARAAGDSWAVIGAALDTSRQNAYQRFGREGPRVRA